MGHDPFERERQIINRCEGLLTDDDSNKRFRNDFEFLLEAYKKLLKTSSRLIRMSDRNEMKLKTAEEALSRANERMESELNVGREIQMKMVPFNFDVYKNRKEFSIYAILEPAREVGGDFYDFFFIDEEWFCINIGDVSGKGVPAALFMAVTKTMIKTRAADDHSPASIITHVNDELSADNPSCMFVTVFVGLLNIKTGEFLYTNAGHNPPYIRRKSGKIDAMDQRHGPVIGAMGDLAYREHKIILNQGDRVFMYTDGVTEAMNSRNELYGDPRLFVLLSTMVANGVENLVRNVLDNVMNFTGEADQADDITILAVEFGGESKDECSLVSTITINNRLSEIEAANNKFKNFADQCGISGAVQTRMYLVLDEILNNIISYAYKDLEEHEIEIKFERTGRRLVISIADDGTPFNPFSAAQPDTGLAMEDRGVGGLGVHLVRNMMDECSYHRHIDKNLVILVKCLE